MLSPFHNLERSLATLDALSRASATPQRSAFQLPVDVYETDDAFLLTAFVPGVNAEDVNVEFDDGVLTLSVERKLTAPEDARPLLREVRSGQAQRRFTLRVRVDVDAAEARLSEGVLFLRLPKVEASGARRIPVAEA